MKTYVFTKKIEGQDMYLQPNGKFSGQEDTAKEYKGKFWIELLKILIQLISIFGIGKLKLKK